MILRRIAGLTVWMLLLKLSFTPSDVACVKHDAHSPDATHHAVASQQATEGSLDHDHGQATAGTADRSHDPADESNPCEIPAQSDCCQALVSCSMTLGFAASSSATDSPVEHYAVAAYAAEAPAYLIRAPEPPPPKA